MAEELGRSIYPGPVLPTNVVAFALASSGLRRAGQGAPAGHLGWSGDRGRGPFPKKTTGGERRPARVEATAVGTGYRLTGVKSPIQDAQVADHLLVSARTPGGITQFLVPADSPGLSVTPLRSLDLARRFARVIL